MAFVLVAILIFFGFIAVIFLSFQMSSLKATQVSLAQEEAKQLAYKFASTPEFAFTSSSSCTNCIDLDKVLVLKDIISYSGFWNQLDYIEIERIYPSNFTGECNKGKYPDCRTIHILNSSATTGIPESAFVTLVHYDAATNNMIYELGRIHVKAKPKH